MLYVKKQMITKKNNSNNVFIFTAGTVIWNGILFSIIKHEEKNRSGFSCDIYLTRIHF